MSRLLYLKNDSKGTYLTYWDIEKNEKVLDYESHSGIFYPQWSPDGKHFTFIDSTGKSLAHHDELIISDWDGNLSQLTDFSAYGDFAYINGYSWSPDGKYIALTFSTSLVKDLHKDVIRYLFVINLETGEITDYCVPIAGAEAPVWSPNSQYVAVNSQNKCCSFSNTIIFNIQNGHAAETAEGKSPLVWMK